MSEYLCLLVLDDYINHESESGTGLPQTGTVYPRSSLEMGQDYAVLGQIIDLSAWRRAKSYGVPYIREEIPKKPHVRTQSLPGDLGVYIDRHDGYRVTRTDDTGSEMAWARAEDLATIDVPQEVGPVTERNNAVKAYLGAIAADTPVILYRH